jgi:hypothetical protein
MFLGMINLIHGAFIRRQRQWYLVLDEKLAEAAGVKRVSLPGLSMHFIFGLMYWGMAGLAFGAAILLMLYGPVQVSSSQ